jgi:hypothetical protein
MVKLVRVLAVCTKEVQNSSGGEIIFQKNCLVMSFVRIVISCYKYS